MKQKIIGFFALLYSIINCTSTNIKSREVWAEKQENIATLSPSYKLINKVSGQGCVTKGFLWGFDAETESYYEDIKPEDPYKAALSIASYQALTKEPEADVFLQTASFLDQKDNKVCAEVRGLAVQIVDIQTFGNITKNDLNLYKQDTKDTGNKK